MFIKIKVMKIKYVIHQVYDSPLVKIKESSNGSISVPARVFVKLRDSDNFKSHYDTKTEAIQALLINGDKLPKTFEYNTGLQITYTILEEFY